MFLIFLFSMNKIPVYEAKIVNFTQGIINVSLVDAPAVERNFLAFNKEVKEAFKVEDEEQRIIYGPIMRADFLIYRRSDEMGEYYITYSKETIKEMAEKWLSDGRQNNINLMHVDGTNVQGVNMREVFIKDSANGLDPKGFEDVEDGSLFAKFHVENDDVWEAVKDGTFKGFSLEGWFDVQKLRKQNKNKNMTKLKQALKRILEAFSTIETDNGELEYEGELEVGTEVTIDGNPAPDGVYSTSDKEYIVAEGKVSEIRDKEATPEEEQPSEEQVEMNSQKEKFNKLKVAFEESYEEKERKIAEAIYAKGFECWIVEAGDDFAVVELWVEDTLDYKHYRFPIEWDAEGNAIAGDPEEVKSAFVPVDENVPEVSEEVRETEVSEEFEEEKPAEDVVDEAEKEVRDLEAEIDELKDGIAYLKEKIEELAGKPADVSIEETFASIDTKKMTRAERMASYVNRK